MSHSDASFIGRVESVQLTTLPSFSRLIRPALSRMPRCFMNPGKDMSNGRDSSVTGRLPSTSVLTTSRRVGSASAAKTALSSFSEYLTIRFTINRSEHLVKPCFWDLQLVQAFRGQMRDVAPGVEQPAPIGETEMIEARVGEGIAALRLQRNIHCVPIHRSERAAVRDHGDVPSPRPRGDRLERRDDAIAKLRGALSLGRNVVRVAGTEFFEFLRKCALDPREAMAFKNAVVALAQRRFVDDRQAHRRTDRGRSFARSSRVARTNRVDSLARKTRGQGADLLATGCGEHAVRVIALDAARAVPFRLAVADEDEPRFSHGAAPASVRAAASRSPIRRARRYRLPRA